MSRPGYTDDYDDECGRLNCPRCEDPEAGTLHRHPPAADDARESLAQELREGLRKRGLWSPTKQQPVSDLITALFQAIDSRPPASEPSVDVEALIVTAREAAWSAARLNVSDSVDTVERAIRAYFAREEK